jgi:hypothetical protein
VTFAMPVDEYLAESAPDSAAGIIALDALHHNLLTGRTGAPGCVASKPRRFPKQARIVWRPGAVDESPCMAVSTLNRL